MVRRLLLAAAVFATLGSTVLASSAVEAAQPKLTDGSKWTVQSQVGLCPIRQIIGAPGHLTWVMGAPAPRWPGTYKTSGKSIKEKAPGYRPGPVAFSGTWSKTQNEYVGTESLGTKQYPATLSPGVVKGCSA